MGVLDDAIREHLDLKRQHGAAEDEVLRQEAEALGPARRDAPAALGEAVANGPGEPVVIDPVADVAPPPEREPQTAPAPVHDIDEDPLAPPPPVPHVQDPDATVEYDALRDDRDDPQGSRPGR
ncbi:MAG: hypothetical protein QOD53_846 [Thermoleophilaceae bacterium]|jgi:hypothetical protein|nr:hypothetical protein [Thermoleophilaceae bacterium]MEA2403954.1 hypothetical protein [Thermoleophilaceae bacterium]